MRHQLKYTKMIVFLLLVVSCKQTSNTEVITEDPVSKEDSTEVLRLSTEYLECLKNKEFDKAIQMLHVVRNDSVFALDGKGRTELEGQYKYFPVLSYQIEHFYFYNNHNSEVAYSIKFFQKEEGDDRPNTLNFRLNPRKTDGVWLLTVSNRIAENPV